METWNERIARLVEESPYNRRQIAKLLDVSDPTVAAWVAAKNARPVKNISGEHLLKVCKFFSVRPEWLIFGQEPMYPKTDRADTPEMAEIIALLRQIDQTGGPAREDAIYFISRLLHKDSTAERKVG